MKKNIKTIIFSLIIIISSIWLFTNLYATYHDIINDFGEHIYLIDHDGDWLSEAQHQSFIITAQGIYNAHDHQYSIITPSYDSPTYASCANWVSISLNPITYYLPYTYISSRTTTWTDCNINSNWTNDYEISCKQTSSSTPNYTNAQQICSTSCTNKIPDASKPTNWSNTLTLKWTVSVWSCENNNNVTMYANNYDTCNIKVDIKFNIKTGLLEDNKSIVWSNKAVWEIFDNSMQKSNLINWVYDLNTNNALNFENVSNSVISGSNLDYSFNINWIKARTPFARTNWSVKFKLRWLNDFLTFQTNNIVYSFNKPYIWKLNVVDNSWSILTGWLVAWTEQNLKLIKENKSLVTDIINIFSLSNYKESLGLEWNYAFFGAVNNPDTNNIIHNIIIDYTWNETVWAPTVFAKPYIEYKVDNHIVKYQLWEDTAPTNTTNSTYNDNSKITLSWKDFLWVKILWSQQLFWKYTLTKQEGNFSDILKKAELRRDIRKNAYTIIKWMNSWESLWKIYYIKWNKNISDLNTENIDTIIVKDWNLVIDRNIDKTLWIIVLKDNYVVGWDMTKWWNVYITSNVTYIDAIIYADWWLISKYYSSNRTEELNKQLVLKWSLFTRNTVWWAIKSIQGNYLLPGGKTTNSFSEAREYDLDYIRRWNEWALLNNNDLFNDRYPFVILYNSQIQINPPKWFDF